MSTDSPTEAIPATAPGRDTAATNHLRFAAVFSVVAVALLIVPALQLIEPRFLGGFAPLSYGRLIPMAGLASVYGWATMGLLGAALYIAPRVSGRPLWNERLAAGGFLASALGWVAGLIALALGGSEGRALVEAPLWADVIVLAGMAAVAVVVTRTMTPVAEVEPAGWYVLAATWWLVVLHVGGNVPGIGGIDAAIQSSFYQAGITGLWLGAAGLGTAYYLVPRLAGREPRVTQLGVLGFWSLVLAWPGVAPRYTMYGPTPDWLETLGVVFSIGLVLGVALVVGDLALMLRDRTGPASVALRFTVGGLVAFALAAAANLALAFRASSAVVQFTDWLAGFEYLTVLGAAGFWVIAIIYHAAAERGRRAAPAAARSHWWLAVSGLTVAVLAALTGGLQQGFVWASGANSRAFVGAGDGFFASADSIEAFLVAGAVGLGIFGLGQLVFVAGLLRPGAPVPEPETGDDDDAVAGLEASPPAPLRLARQATGVVVAMALLVWLIPSLEGSEATLLADRSRNVTGAAAEGRSLYLAEGCWYCHTQQVRPIVTDVGLGPVSVGGDYVHETPVLLGTQRIGPDLMHAGSREGTDSLVWVRDHLESPRTLRPWSTMPAYSFLSERELEALAAYVTSLE